MIIRSRHDSRQQQAGAIHIAWLLLATLSLTPRVFGGDSSLHLDLGCAVVHGSINERPARILVDTGATHSGFSTHFRNRLGVRVSSKKEFTTPSGIVVLPVCEQVHLKIGEHHVQTINPVEFEFGILDTTENVGFDVIIGIDVLSQHIVAISGGTVSIRDAVPANVEAIQMLTLQRQAVEVVAIPIMFSGLAGQHVTIDTGAASTLRLNADMIASLKVNQQIVPGLVFRVSDAKGVFNRTGYILREIIVGGVRFRNVPVSLANDNAIGLGLLRHLNLVLDFQHGKVIIGKPLKQVVDHFPQNASGMGIRFDEEDNLKVLAVRPGGPAELAGIEVGDVALKLDDKNPFDLSIYDVDDILAQNGRSIPIRLRRNTTEFTVDLPLKLPFEYPPNWAKLDKEQEEFEQFLRDENKLDSEQEKKCR